MKKLIVYSSKTGNTKSVAEAIATSLEDATLMDVKESPNFEEYDCIICGYWVDKGMPDALAKNYIESINNKNIILFGTLGAFPDGEHAQYCKEQANKLLENKNNNLLGSWLCMGRVDPKLLERIAQSFTADNPMPEERKARIEEGNKHPNEEDFNNAIAFVEDALKKVELL